MSQLVGRGCFSQPLQPPRSLLFCPICTALSVLPREWVVQAWTAGTVIAHLLSSLWCQHRLGQAGAPENIGVEVSFSTEPLLALMLLQLHPQVLLIVAMMILLLLATTNNHTVVAREPPFPAVSLPTHGSSVENGVGSGCHHSGRRGL